jgi:hypothetical protein
VDNPKNCFKKILSLPKFFEAIAKMLAEQAKIDDG